MAKRLRDTSKKSTERLMYAAKISMIKFRVLQIYGIPRINKVPALRVYLGKILRFIYWIAQ